MYCVSVILSSDEWVTICDTASKQWPQECLSRSVQASMEANDVRLNH
jgi:hypothetical protein